MAILNVTMHRFAHRRTWLIGWGVAWCMLVTAASAQPAALREYQLKALFLFNFAEFVAWPSTAFVDAQAPLVIGVLGDDPFGSDLDRTVRGEKINSHPLVVRRFGRTDDITDCHILFISRSETAHLDEIFARLRGRSILTVGDAEGFSLNGGMIRFVTENNKTHLRINVEAARNASLTISSKLLRPAEIVTTGRD